MRMLIGLMMLLGFCVFMGVTAISMGVGAILPAVNQVAAPVLCPGGEMVSETTSTSPMPGRTYISSSYSCVDASGTRTPVSGVALIAGPIQGLCLFVGLSPLILVSALRRRSAPPIQQPVANFPGGMPPR